MAYIQDISVLMRELLKVPKDYTPTAMEISKYIKSRYSEKDIGKRPMGTRAYSSGRPEVIMKKTDATPLTINAPPQPPKPSRMVAKQRAAGRNLSFSSLHPSVNRKSIKKPNETVLRRGNFKSSNKYNQDRTYHRESPAGAKNTNKPVTAQTQLPNARLPQAQNRSFWNWQSAKNRVRRAVSEITTTPPSKTKLSALAEQHRMDPNMEMALEKQRKEMLKHMLEPGVERMEPVRNREIIQKLMEDNKLEIQRREIAKLTELARTKVLEARRAAFAKNVKKREMEWNMR